MPKNKSRRAYLYAIRLPVNDYAVAYVGVTKWLRARFDRHASNGDDSLIGAAVKECGAQFVLFEVLECGDSERIYAREVELIAKLGTRWPAGYNLAPGGSGGRDPLPRTREKIGAAHRGKIVSAETRAKQAAAKLGRKQLPELIAKRTAGQKGRPLHPNTRAAISHPRPLAVRQRIALGVERSWIERHANG